MANEPRIYSIKEVNRYIKMKLESDQLLGDLWLRGEISNFTHHSSGHMYFTLKDKDSRLKCIMFASHNQRLPFIPREGTKVIARGNISVYERDGNVQYYVNAMQPDGIGSLYLAFEQLKAKLEAEGLFAAERKRQIPVYPSTIGVVTSPTGAAIRDILITLERRYPAARILVYPALVQGKGAAPSIVKAIEALNVLTEPDVIIVGRGGGSLEELWAFNEEVVARAIAASAIPIISAVGHETDFTIADFVADLRAPTPTAAAELAVPHLAELRRQLSFREQQLQEALQLFVERRRERLQRAMRSPFFLHPRRYLLEQAQSLDRLTDRLQQRSLGRIQREQARYERLAMRLAAVHPGERKAAEAKRLKQASRNLEAAMSGIVKDNRYKLAFAVRHLDALSPLKIMSRGYSLIYDDQEKKIIRSTKDVQPGDMLSIKLADGSLYANVWSIKEEES